MGEEECMDCSKWAENIYWSRFSPLQFCQILPRSFARHLTIPSKFVNNIREKLTGMIILRGPSGGMWEVGLIIDGDELLMKHGWKEFARDHSLQENDILIFKYNGNSRFDVSIFNQENMCERETSYFVKKCAHTEKRRLIKQRRRRLRESPDQDTNESSDDETEPSRVKHQRTAAAATGSTSRRQPVRATPRGRRGIKKGRQGSGNAYVYELKSNRREVTEEEKEKAKQRALAAASKNCFIVIMRVSHVYKGFYMSIPFEWAKTHLHKKSKDVELRFNGKTWPARYHYRGIGGALSGGWKHFVVDNVLEEFDVCVFDLVDGAATVPILDVQIFRVVEEVTKPSPLTRSTLRNTGKELGKYSEDANGGGDE